jgi:hypothetical protein
MRKTWACGLVAALLMGCGGSPSSSSNSILVIAPYRYAGTWVFDDERVGLAREPFVSGAPELIDRIVTGIPNAEKGFRLYFSARPFPGGAHTLAWRRGDRTGNWYYSAEFEAECWLYPSLFKYYRVAPRTLYVKAEPREDVQPAPVAGGRSE